MIGKTGTTRFTGKVFMEQPVSRYAINRLLSQAVDDQSVVYGELARSWRL